MMKKLINSTVFALGIVGVAIASSAQANQTAYKIVSVATGKCLALSSNSSANGVNIHQWQCSNVQDSANLLWTFHDVGSGQAHIRNAGTGKCIALKSASSANGVNIHQWQCDNVHNEDNIRWAVSASGGGTGEYKLVSEESGKCIALKSHSGGNGVNIHQWQCNNVNDEDYLIWRLE